MPELHRKYQSIMVALIIQGAFHSSKKFVTLETKANDTKFSLEVSKKPQFDEFPKYKVNNPKFGKIRAETQMARKFSVRMLKIHFDLHGNVSFVLEITENAVPFDIEKFTAIEMRSAHNP